MMSGTTLNLCMKVGNRDPVDVKFLLAAIMHYSGGVALFKYLDLKLEGRRTCTAVAPVVFGLHAASDRLRAVYPESRWHMVLLAITGGLLNGVSAEKLKCV